MWKIVPFTIYILSLGILFPGCSEPLQWPDSPLYEYPEISEKAMQEDLQQIMQQLEGRYAHYDIVSYEDKSTKTPMKTFVISYGITEFFMEEGELYQKDRFLSASHKINQPGVRSWMSDEAAKAIEPRIEKVDLQYVDGKWQIYRPPTPTLLGIEGDDNLPLSRDPEDPRLTDPDGDGNPGVTVHLEIMKWIKGEIYLTRREIFTNYLTLYPDGILRGHVVDESEQFIIDATMKVLKQESNNQQLPDPGMNPLILIPIDDQISDEELMEQRDRFFPPEPEFK